MLKKVTIANILFDVAEKKKIDSLLTSAFNFEEPTKVSAVLTFVHDTLEDDEMKHLKEFKKAKKDLLQICEDVQSRCMKKIHDDEIELKIYEGTDSVEKRLKNKLKTFVSGVGAKLSTIKRRRKELVDE